MIAVDTTVLADLLFNQGDLRAAALRLQEIDPEWICLSLARYELGNVAWKLAKLVGVDAAILQSGLVGAEEMILEFVDDLDPAAVLGIAMDRDMTFYDASHVWLACERQVVLYSRDGRLAGKCPECVRPMPTL